MLIQVISLEADASDILSLTKGLRNSTTLAGRLPRDVIEKIMMRASKRDLVRASRLCRRWRDSLASSPRLWTEFQCEHVAQTLQHLKLSQPFPINVTTGYGSDVRAVIALKSATERFKSLTLHLSPSDLGLVFGELVTPAPTLEYLKITAAFTIESNNWVDVDIPAKFLQGHTPALKSLIINGISTSSYYFQFPALTRLSLTTDTGTFYMSQLFQLFASARLLEVVFVQFCGDTVPVQESQDIIRLPRIRALTFSNAVGYFPTQLLFLLDTPSVEEFMLDISLPDEDTRTMRDFLPPLHILSLDNLELDVATAYCYIKFDGPDRLVSIDVQSEEGGRVDDDFQSRWFDFLEPGPFAHVKHLTLRNYNPTEQFNQYSVLELLRTMAGVRSLIVERCSNTRIVEALSLSTEQGRIDLFPELESLTLRGHVQEGIFPGLRDMARVREGTGFRLSDVSFDQYVYDSDADSFKPYVGRVERNTGL